MIDFKNFEVWFVTGSQNLYGEDVLKQVAKDSEKISGYLSENLSVKVVIKPVMTTADAIYKLALEANSNTNCIGLITWMHTFSPAKMWIAGLNTLKKPFLHFHTQFNKKIPWSDIDMNFMNLNQSAHGGREFGFIGSRLRINRKVVVGFWQDKDVIAKIDIWVRAAAAWHDSQGAKVARFGDNMRNVAVTEGDKVSAQIKLGYEVHGYAIGDLVKFIEAVTDSQVKTLVDEYKSMYTFKGTDDKPLKDSAKIELGMRAFLKAGEFKAFTTSFEDLYGMEQLPGVAVQRLMHDGYGFGAEGDWKTSMLVRSMKVMGHGLKGGASFMEDYTYDLDEKGMKVLGAHMLEICSSIAEGKPSLEVHPLSIGGKDDPVRLVFNVAKGPAVNATVVDMGNRYRIIVNDLEVIPPDAPLPNLPVARALWIPKPNLQIGAAAWILAGGAHHAGFSQVVTKEHLEDFAEMANMEYLVIDDNTKINEFKKELRWNEMYYHLANGVK